MSSFPSFQKNPGNTKKVGKISPICWWLTVSRSTVQGFWVAVSSSIKVSKYGAIKMRMMTQHLRKNSQLDTKDDSP